MAENIVFLENMVDIHRDLKERFSKGVLIRILELQQEIYGLKHGTLNVTEYFEKLKIYLIQKKSNQQ